MLAGEKIQGDKEKKRLQAVAELKAKQTKMQSELDKHPTPLGAPYKVTVIEKAVQSDTTAYGFMIETSSRGLNAAHPGDFDYVQIISSGRVILDPSSTRNQSIFQGSAALDYLERKWAFLKHCPTIWTEVKNLLRVEQFEDRKSRFDAIVTHYRRSLAHYVTDFGGLKVRGIGAGEYILYENGTLYKNYPLQGENKVPDDQAKAIALDIRLFYRNLYIRQFIEDFL